MSSPTSAIIRRELSSYFSSPTGYVFITIFIFLSAFAAFWLPGFFNRNLANLDQLSAWYPALLLFLVPAITMGAWAEERRQGTEELLLTLPATDRQLVLGKYLACVAIYTVALAFALSHLVVLAFLGAPDPGLMASTYFGFWLAGAALIALGLVASALTSNLTISFILGALLCAAVVGLGALAPALPGALLPDLARSLSLPARLADFGRGIVSLENIAYFAAIAGLGLWANTFLVGRRHWAGSPGSRTRSSLAAVRAIALFVAAFSIVALAGRTPLRADATAERLWSLSPETRRLVSEIPPDRPVLITAYISPDVPGAYAETRETLLGLLREIHSLGAGSRIAVNIIDTEPYSEAAREALRNHAVRPRGVPASPGDADQTAREIFLAIAVSCGPEQSVIPFLSRGVPLEYELARAIRAVSVAGRKKVGVLDTDAALHGKFDFQTYTPGRDWAIIAELSKQYEVVRVPRGEPVPDDVDVLLAAQPSSLAPDQLETLIAHVASGRPTLIFEDPLPLVMPGLATSEPPGATMNPFQRQQQPSAPKADLAPLYSLLGVESPPKRVTWDAHNPRPQLAGLPREFVFVGRSSGGVQPFNDEDNITSSLQEVVMMCAGEVTPAPAASASGPLFTPLLRTGPVSGFVNYDELLQRSFFGPTGLNPRRTFHQTEGGHILAARITASGDAPLNVVFVADLDVISEEFFNLRESGVEDFHFDNVTFVLNAVDVLAGDDSLVELRKRRRAHRTLTRLETRRLAEQREALEAIDAANAGAEAELATARARMQQKITEIEARADLDETTRSIMAQSVREAEQRRLNVQTASIEDQKQAAIDEARISARQDIDRIQMGIRVAAVALPPVPALALAGVVLARRRMNEREGVSPDRLDRPQQPSQPPT